MSIRGATTDPSCVYRAFAADGELLYVGASLVPGQRIAEHQKSAPWWIDVARITLEHFDSQEAALAAETAAIKAEGPLYNIASNTPARRAEARSRRARRYFLSNSFETHGLIVCDNCGDHPERLQQRKRLDELDCPRCKCSKSLRRLTSLEAAA